MITIETTECVQVKVKANFDDNKGIYDLQRYIIDKNLISIASSSMSPTSYIAYHTKEDAEKIKQFINQYQSNE